MNESRPLLIQNRKQRDKYQDPPMSWRAKVWGVLHYRSSVQHVSGIQRLSYFVELFLLNLILINVIVTIVSSSEMVDASQPAQEGIVSQWFSKLVIFSTVIFTIEYSLRLWSCVEDPRYPHWFVGRLTWMLRPLSLIDLISLLPYFLEVVLRMDSQVSVTYRGSTAIRGLRLLRIISFLRIERSYDAMKKLRIIFQRKRQEFFVVSYLTGVIILIAATTMFFLEFPENPEAFSSIGLGAWWAVETITSLGYGDTIPKTTAGRIFSSLVAVWGIVLFSIPGAILGSGFVEVMLEDQKKRELQNKEKIIQSITSELGRLRQTAIQSPPRSHHASSSVFRADTDTTATPPPSAATAAPLSYDSCPQNILELPEKLNQVIQNQMVLELQLQFQKEQLDLIIQLLQKHPSHTEEEGSV